jgi:hypothetical protein
MQHREQLFTATPLEGSGSGSAEYLKQLPTEHSRDNRTHKEKMAVLEWVCSFPFSFFFLSLFESDS